jgi:hypothetical protein
MSKTDTNREIIATLSEARMGTYVAAVRGSQDSDTSALALYAWNAQVSAALLVPLHICEVVLRNAVSEAIEAIYGSRWPWSTGFEQSLPAPSSGYSPRQDLLRARSHAPTTGKVIPELKFIFWQRMFTERHDRRLWNLDLIRVLVNLDNRKTIRESRQEIYADLEGARVLRNRIAHHEPIFARNLSKDFESLVMLIGLRSTVAAAWMLDHQQASALIASRP